MIERVLNKPESDVEYDLQYILKGLDVVYAYVKERLEKTDTHVVFDQSDVYPVWYCKTLQHWKMLVSTTLPDGMYYEVTYNGNKNETYVDAYKKFENVAIPD